MTSDEVGADLLPVTLVIPVRDEQETVEALVASIGRQTRGPAEVIFVDGGSSDDTVARLRVEAQRNARYRVVEAGPATPGRGRNVGVAAARHEWVAMTDAGITLDESWLEELWKAHEGRPAAEVVYGNFEFYLRNLFDECAAVAYAEHKRQTPVGRCRGPAIKSCMVHQRAFHALGGFLDSRSGEDEVFMRAVESQGIEIAWAPRATVRWELRPDLLSTLERFRSYSFHYVVAGEQQHWHVPLARSYVPVLAGLVLSLWSKRWLALPAATIGGRVAARVRRHREDMPFLSPPDPVRLGLIACILVATDAATAVGWYQARRHLARERTC